MYILGIYSIVCIYFIIIIFKYICKFLCMHSNKHSQNLWNESNCHIWAYVHAWSTYIRVYIYSNLKILYVKTD